MPESPVASTSPKGPAPDSESAPLRPSANGARAFRPSDEKLIVRGAREHNLTNIDVELPRERLSVITGLSGSGKSSLAFDTIYAEG